MKFLPYFGNIWSVAFAVIPNEHGTRDTHREGWSSILSRPEGLLLLRMEIIKGAIADSLIRAVNMEQEKIRKKFKSMT